MLSLHTLLFEEHGNDTKLRAELDLLKGRRDDTTSTSKRATRYYNVRVKGRSFNIGDLVLQKVTLNTREVEADSLGPS